MLVVSTSEFREKQKSFLEIADSGKQVVISRGQKQAYLLMPINEGDFMLTPEIMKRLEKSRKQFREGNVTTCHTAKEIISHLESL